MNQYATEFVEMGLVIWVQHLLKLLFAFLIIYKFIQWKLGHVQLEWELEIIVQFYPNHIFHIKLKPFKCENKNFRKVFYEWPLNNRRFLLKFLTIYLIV